MPPMLRITRPKPAFDADALLGSTEGTSSLMHLDGAAKLSVSSRSGKEAVVAMIETGAFFGESA